MRNIDEARLQAFVYSVKKNKWSIFSVALLFCDAACVLLFDVLNWSIVLGLMAIITIVMFVCIAKIQRPSKEESLRVIETPVNVDKDVLLGDEMKEYVLYGTDKNAYVASAKINAAIQTNNFVIDPEIIEYKLSEHLLEHSDILKADRNTFLPKSASLRRNKSVMGIAAGLDEKSGNVISLKKTSRFAVQITDDAFRKNIVNQKKISNKIIYRGSENVLSETGQLLPFIKSNNANEFDVDAILISNDAKMIMARGTADHPLFPDKIVCPVACSLLPEEVAEDLTQSLTNTLTNKFRAIYNVPAETLLRVLPIGYARILERGGSPEFYCLMFVDLPAASIVAANNDPTIELNTDEKITDGNNSLNLADIIVAAGAVKKALTNELSVSALACLSTILSISTNQPKLNEEIGAWKDDATGTRTEE